MTVLTSRRQFLAAAAASLLPTTLRASPASDATLNDFLAAEFATQLKRDPQFATVIGAEADHGAWTVRSEAYLAEEQSLAKDALAKLAGFRTDTLSPSARISHRLYEDAQRRTLRDYGWRLHSYAFTKMEGPYTEAPSFLANYHRVRTLKDAQDYVARLRTLPAYLDNAAQELKRRADRGMIPPAFNFPIMLEATRGVITGKPFDNGPADTLMLADFKKKVTAAGIAEPQRTQLVLEAESALRERVGPAYARMIDAIKEVGAKAKGSNGVWALPDGDGFYRNQILGETTLPLEPEAIHQLGLAEVARLREEMAQVAAKVKFSGKVDAFIAALLKDPKFLEPDTDEGRQRFLAKATQIIGNMRAELPRFFSLLPKSPIEVRRVETFREDSTASAFYERGTPDGSRPGAFYANLKHMADNPTWQLQSLCYHEGVPGHHMQIAIAQELTDVPAFRRFVLHTAYVEGWALYAERFPKEFGFFEDPYSDAGRISGELLRACRLVADTGIHFKRWSREQAIQFMVANSASTEGDCTGEVERYFCWPGQALAYKIGMNRILEQRERAKREMGQRFDIRTFHDTVLANGSVPLPVLDDMVGDYIKRPA